MIGSGIAGVAGCEQRSGFIDRRGRDSGIPIDIP